MRKLLLMTCLLLGAYIPPPEPTNIPFTYDPSVVNHLIIEWFEVSPGEVLNFTRYTIEEDGEVATFNVIASAGSAVTGTLVSVVTNPDGAVRRDYSCQWTAPPTEGVVTLDCISTDSQGLSVDGVSQRTILINVRKINRPPIIY